MTMTRDQLEAVFYGAMIAMSFGQSFHARTLIKLGEAHCGEILLVGVRNYKEAKERLAAS